MLSDEQLQLIGDQVDKFIIDICNQHQEHPLNISAIMLARMYIAAMAGKCTQDFKAILQSILDNESIITEDIVKH